MKNKLTLAIACSILFFVGLGCGGLNPFSGSSEPAANSARDANRTITDDAVDVAVGTEKIGVPECDEVIEFLNAELNDPNDNFISKSIKQTALNQIKESIRKSVEESKSKPDELAKLCKDFGENLRKNKEAETNN